MFSTFYVGARDILVTFDDACPTSSASAVLLSEARQHYDDLYRYAVQVFEHAHMRDKHVDDVSLHTYIHTYIHTYNIIHTYSEFAKCYSCIRGSLRLATNKVTYREAAYISVGAQSWSRSHFLKYTFAYDLILRFRKLGLADLQCGFYLRPLFGEYWFLMIR